MTYTIRVKTDAPKGLLVQLARLAEDIGADGPPKATGIDTMQVYVVCVGSEHRSAAVNWTYSAGLVVEDAGPSALGARVANL